MELKCDGSAAPGHFTARTAALMNVEQNDLLFQSLSQKTTLFSCDDDVNLTRYRRKTDGTRGPDGLTG